jgi:glycerate kinase
VHATFHVLAAPDKFRGTATAPEVARAVVGAVEAAGGTAEALPLADGGEGTLDAFGGPNRWTRVTGPLGSPVEAGWRLTEGGDAVIEMATASGLLVAGGAASNDPWSATTRGTGELIGAAAAAGARRIIVGLGGSATTDGGLGALEALQDDQHWRRDPASRPELLVCCDVRDTFIDAARVFSPQKGATPALVDRLERRLVGLADRYQREYGLDVRRLPGSGAAGGLAGGLAALGARLLPGFDVIATATGLDEAVARAHLVVTGEGRLDNGSFNGKVVGGVHTLASRAGRPVLAVVGAVDPHIGALPEGLTVVSLTDRFGAAAALEQTAIRIREALTEVLRSR